MLDPRIAIINQRLSGVKRVIAVSSGKGGVGKSLVATALALTLAGRNFKVGLFDLDFTGPSTHLILGIKKVRFKEDKGIIPAQVNGLKYASIVGYSNDEVLPLRGADFSNALVELFTITIWGFLDYLILDMPPGINDAVLELIRLVKGLEFLIVTTPSILAFETVRKLVKLLSDLKIPILGVIENMKMNKDISIRKKVELLNVNFIGELPFDMKVEKALGDVNALVSTDFAKKLAETILEKFNPF